MTDPKIIKDFKVIASFDDNENTWTIARAPAGSFDLKGNLIPDDERVRVYVRRTDEAGTEYLTRIEHTGTPVYLRALQVLADLVERLSQ